MPLVQYIQYILIRIYDRTATLDDTGLLHQHCSRMDFISIFVEGVAREVVGMWDVFASAMLYLVVVGRQL